MNDRQLRYALAIWNERSFSGAAAKVGVSQPSLSEQIRLLEDELGFKLFYRNSRGIEISANGQAFLEAAASVVSELAELKDLARELGGKPGANLRIGVNSGLAQGVLPRVAPTLYGGKVQLSTEVVTATNRRILRLLQQQRLDFGVVFDSEIKPTAEIRRSEVAQTDVVVLLAPGHALGGHADPLELPELARHPLIVNEPRIGYGKAVLSRLVDAGLAPKIAADCDDIESLKYLVCAGAGIGLAPRIAAQRELDQGSLQAIGIRDLLPLGICLVRRPAALTPRLERIFTQFAQDLIKLQAAEIKFEATASE